ncbi:MAG TPA: hypothetical protein VFC19_49415 [Candidatus Limnocylindrales bacterium]|nr:hypothetical protein [Candidatus Limnocylindrales bacterium]
MTEKEVTLWGLQCGDEQHPECGYIYGTGINEQQARRLAEGVACYRLIQSLDGGRTWQAATP